MNPRDAGFLLLTSYLGDPTRKPLTVARFRELTKKARLMEKPVQEREMSVQDLQAIGCSLEESQRILHLLSEEELLRCYVNRGKRADCYPLTRASEQYPQSLRKALSLEAPGTLWYKGALALLEKPKIALVGSRNLSEENRKFAEAVGAACARQGYVLVSGHAQGADSVAENACLAAGGQVISVVSDPLQNHPEQENTLFLAEDGYDIPFAPYRALSRNRIIHALGEKTFVAQCTGEKGGTWDGTVKNLRFGWNPVFCYADHSPTSRELESRGAVLIAEKDLQDFSSLQSPTISFL